MRFLVTQGGETIDMIVHAHYGDLSMINEVVRANDHLDLLAFILPRGLTIKLPEKTPEPKKAITLW